MHTLLTRVWIVPIRKCVVVRRWHISSKRFSSQIKGWLSLLTEGIQRYIVPDSSSNSVCCHNSAKGGAWRDCANRGIQPDSLGVSVSDPGGSPLFLAGQTFSDNGEWKPSISSDTGGGSQSLVLLPPCNKQFQEANCSRLTRWLRPFAVQRMKCRVLFKLFCELLYTKPLGFGRGACGGGTNVYLCTLCCVEYNIVHCSYCLVCGDGKFQNSNY